MEHITTSVSDRVNRITAQLDEALEGVDADSQRTGGPRRPRPRPFTWDDRARAFTKRNGGAASVSDLINASKDNSAAP